MKRINMCQDLLTDQCMIDDDSYTPSGDQPMGEQEMKICGVQ